MLAAMTAPSRGNGRPAVVEPTSHKYRLIDQRMQDLGHGPLSAYLRVERLSGLSYHVIAQNLTNMTNESMTFEGVRGWCDKLFGPGGMPGAGRRRSR